MKRLIDSVDIHIDPSEDSPDCHAIAIDRLLDFMHGLNEVVSALVDSKIEDLSDERTKSSLTESAKNHYRLYAKPAVHGSYCFALDMYDTRESKENNNPLFSDMEVSFSNVERIINYVAAADYERFAEAVKSPVVADKVLGGIEKIAPKDGERVTVVYPGERKPFSVPENVKKHRY